MDDRIPIEQIILNEGDPDRWVDAYRRYALKAGDTFQIKLARHKARFGRQTKTVLGSEYRLWIWERPHYTITLSKRGTEISIAPWRGLSEAWDAWREYLRDYGLL
jgi:hypothetical protein